MQRECTICLQAKPFEEFAKSKKGKFGIEAQCKRCKYLKNGKAYYQKNKDKCDQNAAKWAKRNREKINERARERYEADPEKILRKQRTYRKSDKTAAKNYRARHKEKINAQSKLRDHIKRGNIIKPLFCSLCNSTKWIEGHHRDYSKPLEVVWLCRKCHVAIHRRLSTLKNEEL